jgi:Tol biopolymer transport system component
MRTITFGIVLLLFPGLALLSQAQEVSIHGQSNSEPRVFRQSDLVIVATDGSGEYRLTDTLASEGEPAWSPDGSRVVFTVGTGPHNDLFMVNVDGSALTNVTNTPDIGEGTASWSPDSKRIVFAAGTYTKHRREGSGITSFSIDVTNIHVMNSDGSNREQLTRDESKNYGPVYSRDGRSIAFASGRLGLPEIFIMGADGSDVRRVTESPEGVYCDQPSWSPSGTQLAYTRHEKSTSYIYVTNIDGDQALRITNAPDTESNPVWSPNGQWIGFRAGQDRAQLHIVHPGGQDATRVTNDLKSGFTGLSWSPDQRFFVTQARREPVTKRPLTAYTLWDSGGIGISMAGDDSPRFLGATSQADGSMATRALTETEARAWFIRFNIPFPELPEH